MFDSHQLAETNVFMPLDLSLRSSRFLETLFRRFPSFIAGAMQELKAIGLISEIFKTVESSYSARDGKITVRRTDRSGPSTFSAGRTASRKSCLRPTIGKSR